MQHDILASMSKFDMSNDYEYNPDNLVLFEFVTTTTSPHVTKKQRHRITSPSKTAAKQKNHHQTTPNKR